MMDIDARRWKVIINHGTHGEWLRMMKISNSTRTSNSNSNGISNSSSKEVRKPRSQQAQRPRSHEDKKPGVQEAGSVAFVFS